ncbi:MAG: NADH-quinone oxidoreductase subunit K [Actinomycetales bacterium]
MSLPVLTSALAQTAAVATPAAGEGSAPVHMASSETSVLFAVLIGVLFATGAYLLLQRALTRVLIGLGLLTHAANLLLLSGGGRAGPAPFVSGEGAPEAVVDPLPQAMALTAIVISFAVTALLLGLTYRSVVLVHDDAVQDDPEDRRIQHAAEEHHEEPETEVLR